jgi:hypothetical protein
MLLTLESMTTASGPLAAAAFSIVSLSGNSWTPLRPVTKVKPAPALSVYHPGPLGSSPGWLFSMAATGPAVPPEPVADPWPR